MHDRAVLRVGGRTRVIPVYRELIEDKAGQLGPMLQSADLVYPPGRLHQPHRLLERVLSRYGAPFPAASRGW